MPFQEVLQYLMAVSLTVWLVVEELIHRCGPSAVNAHEPLAATSPGAGQHDHYTSRQRAPAREEL